MNWQAISFDWNHIRAFLATVEEGSFSAAARALGSTQPTLSRQIAGLEEALGIVLFERSRRSMVLTKSGEELLDHVRTMGEAAMRISLAASGQSQTIEGHVSITATGMFVSYLLPKVLAQLREVAPDIVINLVPSDSVQDLTRREADIAIRHVRPNHPDLIAKLAVNSTAHIYASKTYISMLEHPITARSLSKADFLGPQQPEQILPVINTQGLEITEKNFKITTSDGSTMTELVKQGLGVSILPKQIAESAQGLERILPDYSIPMPIWLVTHKELRTTQRIRLVFDLLSSALAEV